MRYFLSILILCVVFSSIQAQIGGRTSYDFLGLSENARIAAIGGDNVSVVDKDPNLSRFNPAAINDSMVGYVSVNYLPFYADVNKSSVTGVFDFGKVGPLAIGVQYISYGEIDEVDFSGNQLGQVFTPREYALSVGKSHVIGPFSMGANLKFVGSHIGDYSAFATMIDAGGIWKHPSRAFTIGMTVNNLGVNLKRYQPDSPVNLPLDVKLGASYKLEHMPLRFSTTIHHLHKYDIQYLDPVRSATTDADGNEVLGEKKVSEQIARHFIFGGEFLLADGFHLRVGYNHLRRKELRRDVKAGGAGFSFGCMLRVKRFEFNYSRTYFHVVGGSNVLTLTTNLQGMISKKARPTKDI